MIDGLRAGVNVSPEVQQCPFDTVVYPSRNWTHLDGTLSTFPIPQRYSIRRPNRPLREWEPHCHRFFDSVPTHMLIQE
jgi:hypothetical protein